MSIAVIYARYSSHSQGEQSIEGQLNACYEYAKRNGIQVIEKYIDRAKTGTSTEKRDRFNDMLTDSAKKRFDMVLVYQLDRFARSRYDSADAKYKLKKNGVKVVSVRENISEDASGVLMEAVLEGMAEYYSAELSQKVCRGIEISAAKFRFTGGRPPLGLMVDKEKKYQIDPETAPIVKKIFEMYAAGYTVKEITDYMNSLEIRTSQGQAFNKNSLRGMLQNKKYIGTYTFHDKETHGVIPRIISDKLFYDVQDRMGKNKKAPARARAKAEYLLTTKLFCGHCKEMMVGVSGTSKTGATHNYYKCKSALHKKGCTKKNVRKNQIEQLVLEKAREQLTEENISIICNEVDKLNKQMEESAEMRRLNRLLNDNAKATENLMVALEQGEIADLVSERISQKRKERQALEVELQNIQMQYAPVTAVETRFFLTKLREGRMDDAIYQRTLIAIFIDSVFLYDDKLTIGFRTSNQPMTISYELIDEIADSASSYMRMSAPPRYKGNPLIRRKFCGG
ncbi:recombinase family protein, partial [Ruminococcaceae bacterium OttesenSCG-928-D13]|nr:recombinase family protein [Ruminococcaceae bacterium OttesenSCG-928-D13]